MKASINPSPRSAAILGMVAALALLAPLTTSASQRVVISAWIAPAVAPFDSCDYVLSSGPGEAVRMALSDPWRRIFGDVPGYQRLTLELTTTWFTLNTGEVPKLLVFQVHPPATMAVKGLSCGADPGRFAACDNGLYPSLDEPLPHNLDFAAATDPDSDGDGVPDSKDAFPNDPGETTDTDGDGIGNNADLDDDNDSMPDSYELANGLNPLVADGGGDLDLDGQTNAEEAVAGSRANDPGSFFRIDSLDPGALARDGLIALTWQALPGRSYSIFYTPDLQSRPVELSSRITVETAGPHREDVKAGRNLGFYFLRAEWLPSP